MIIPNGNTLCKIEVPSGSLKSGARIAPLIDISSTFNFDVSMSDEDTVCDITLDALSVGVSTDEKTPGPQCSLHVCTSDVFSRQVCTTPIGAVFMRASFATNADMFTVLATIEPIRADGVAIVESNMTGPVIREQSSVCVWICIVEIALAVSFEHSISPLSK
jgi:hypothetical protein